MKRFALVLVAAVMSLVGCSESARGPLAPESAQRALLDGSSLDLEPVLEFAALPDLMSSRHAEAFIRASEGGVVELNGFRITIPAGALPQDTLITIDLPQDELLGKRVIAEFGPHGIQFEKPVTISVPLDGVLLNGDPIEIGRWENDGWTSLGGTVSADGASLSTTTPHFSTYAGKYVMAGG